eukprot:403338669
MENQHAHSDAFMKSQQAPGGNSTFSLGWGDQQDNGQVRGKLRKPDGQNDSHNIFQNEQSSQFSSEQQSYVRNQPFASHDEQPTYSQPQRQVQPSPFATDSNNHYEAQQQSRPQYQQQYDNPISYQAPQQQQYQAPPQYQAPSQQAPFASHDKYESNPSSYSTGGRTQNVSAPFGTNNNFQEENKFQGKARSDRIPGSNNGFQLSDNSGMSDKDRFMTSKQQANQQLNESNNVMKAVVGKFSQAAGVVKPQAVNGGQSRVISQITF